ncbi:SanA protein [Alginatibacterium sediminis]|uniref:SanA protein n=1 Tax=Alginatibacterium sediminis TaxID=2164068 RepID=A0A420E9E1_9ALTE|nr:SanA protein [Alginatibacterium sediminis]
MLKVCSASLLLALALLLACDLGLSWSVRKQIIDDFAQVEPVPVALILGTSKYVGKRKNIYYETRLEAGAQLYLRGLVQGLIVSGDNATRYYNEPITMYNDLMSEGIPSAHITMDYAGFRTLDSIVRAQKVFGQTQFIIVSQRFHVERALFIANYYGIKAIGFAVENAPIEYHWRVRLREVLARAKAVFDLYISNEKPRFLGHPEIVGLRELFPESIVDTNMVDTSSSASSE